MNRYIAVLCLFFVYSVRANHKQVHDDLNTYVAAVVEYHPIGNNSYDAIQIALEKYGQFIKEAKENAADIIVFPESALNRYTGTEIEIPHEEENANPCNQSEKYSEILTRLSCAASFEKIYVVVNLAEKYNCNTTSDKDCPSIEYYLFNTNVVFDRNGTIISKYRKINLFGERGFTGSKDKALGVFETDFGVKFGHFICFDLMFQNPAVQIIARENVSNIIFPTMWFSELPFLTAVQIQESWANTHNVNLLAAGANNPHVGSTGTGIYSGSRGTLKAVMNGEAKNQMLVSSLPKDPSVSSFQVERERSNSVRAQFDSNNPVSVMDKLWLKQDNLTVYETRILEVKEQQEFNLTYGDLECKFQVKMKLNVPKLKEGGDDQYVYRAVVFDGVRSYTYKTGGVANCAIVACTSNSLMSCAKRFPDHSTVKPSSAITEIEIAALVSRPVMNTTLQADNIVYHPVTLDTSIMPLNIKNYQFESSKIEGNAKQMMLSMKLVSGHYPDLLTFGFMGRVFDKDGQPVTGGANSLSGTLILLLPAMCMLFNVCQIIPNV